MIVTITISTVTMMIIMIVVIIPTGIQIITQLMIGGRRPGPPAGRPRIGAV